MPTAKPRYDTDGSWKSRNYTGVEWDKLCGSIREKLKPFYPDKSATTDPTFGHPADTWANHLISESQSAISTILWLRRRLTNEELRAERDDVLRNLKKTDLCLGNLSHDLDIMLGVDADIRGARDKIRELIPRFEAAEATIKKLPKAKKLRDAQHEAAVEMAIRVLRILKCQGMPIAATVGGGKGQTAATIQVLKIIGDAIGLQLSETTWKGILAKAKKTPPPLQ